MADNKTQVATEEAPALDMDILNRLVAETVKKQTEAEAQRILDEEAPVVEQKAVIVNPSAKAKEDQPEVKGERVDRWERRAYRFFRAVIDKDSTEFNRQHDGMAALVELNRQERAMTDFQRDEEDSEINALLTGSGFSHKVQKRVHSTLTGPAGEFALPKPFLAELFVIIEQYGLARQLARVVPMGSKDLDLKSVATKPTAAWTSENVLLTSSDMALDEKKLTVNKLGAITSFSSELDEDAFISLMPSWLELVGESIAQKEDQAFFRGDGTSTHGGFTGVMVQSGAQVQNTGSGDLNFSDLVEADLRSTKEKLSLARRMGAVWVMHRGCWNQLEQFESTVGARIVQQLLTDPTAMSTTAPLPFMGFPVRLSEAFQDMTSDVASGYFAVLGNFSRALMGIRRGITVEASRDAVLSNSSGVVQYNAFQQDGQLLKISTRVGFNVPTANEDAFAVLQAPAS